jgi:hypothetical protein
VLQKARAAEILCRSLIMISFLFKHKLGAGLLCPAVLCHIFTVKFGLPGFKIADIVALDQARINAVTRDLVA